MNRCENYEVLVSTWIDGQLDRDGQVELLDHLVRCESCREFYVEARALDGLLAAVRTPAGAGAPPAEVWNRIEQAASGRVVRLRPARRSLVPAWALSAAAALVLAIGLGAVMWGRAPSPDSPVEVRLGARAGQMTEKRFVELTHEVLGAERRYHVALYRVMEQVIRDTTADEASSEGLVGSAESEGEVSFEDPARNPA